MTVLLSTFIFIALLFVLFSLSQLLTKTLFLLFFLLTDNKTTSIHLLAYFLVPGTLVHEISHLFMAGILGVRTGELSIIPQIEEKEVKTGTLKIAKVDPFRRTLIGLAPTLIGSGLMFFINNYFLNLQSLNFYALRVLFSSPLNLVFCYLLLVISLSMFSSKKDLETIFIPLFILFCFSLAFYLGGFQIRFSEKILESLNLLLKNLNTTFLLAVLLEFCLLLAVRFLLLICQRLLKKYVKI